MRAIMLVLQQINAQICDIIQKCLLLIHTKCGGIWAALAGWFWELYEKLVQFRQEYFILTILSIPTNNSCIWLNCSHRMFLSTRPGNGKHHFHAHYIGQFHSPNPTARDSEELVFLYSHEKAMLWETLSSVPTLIDKFLCIKAFSATRSFQKHPMSILEK